MHQLILVASRPGQVPLMLLVRHHFEIPENAVTRIKLSIAGWLKTEIGQEVLAATWGHFTWEDLADFLDVIPAIPSIDCIERYDPGDTVETYSLDLDESLKECA